MADIQIQIDELEKKLSELAKVEKFVMDMQGHSYYVAATKVAEEMQTETMRKLSVAGDLPDIYRLQGQQKALKDIFTKFTAFSGRADQARKTLVTLKEQRNALRRRNDSKRQSSRPVY